MPAAAIACRTHADLFKFRHELPHFAESFRNKPAVRIVAIGSSSTEGEGDLLPYPERLAMLLRGRFGSHKVDVLNRGKGGQEATTELLRFQPDVLDEMPALVIWQVGTNAVYRNKEFDFGEVIAAIRMGLNRLAEHSMDVVIMDSQYVPAVVKDDKLKMSEDMVAAIAEISNAARVNVFRRFDLMRHWVVEDGISIGQLVREGDTDMLHMSDWATDCVTRALSEQIVERVPSPGAT